MDTVSTPTAAAEAKYCIGCGVDMHSKKIYERRLLYSEAGRNIKAIWEEIISMKLSQSGRELDLQSLEHLKIASIYAVHALITTRSSKIYVIKNPKKLF